MLALHLTTHGFSLSKGGLEVWTFQVAKLLSLAKHKVVVHVLDEFNDQELWDREAVKNFEIRLLFNERSLWDAPLKASNWLESRIGLERYRLNFQILRNSVNMEMAKDKESKHILISNFLLGVGFVTSAVAEDLDIPHIACAVGTDFSRGFYNPRERPGIDTVIRNATHIVTKNSKQADIIKKKYKIENVTTIHTSVDKNAFKYEWQRTLNNKVSLFSDNGYSHKKGTQILIWAYEQLLAEGFTLKLIICGGTLEGQEDYWNQLKKTSLLNKGCDIEYIDHLPLSDVWQRMFESSIYCSPTIGEGCSHARAVALCMGIPMVTTNCGEIPDVTKGNHVRLSEPGDAEGFLSSLRELVIELKDSRFQVDRSDLQSLKKFFSPEKEYQQWEALLNNLNQ